MVEEDTSTPTTKTCTKCSRELPRTQFTKHSRSSDGLESRCIECRAHDRRLSQYDLTPQAYLKLGFLQRWQCAICHTPQHELEHGLVVDHDHVTGKVRALLCRECNLGLGNFEDDIERLKRAAEYVDVMKEAA